MRVLDELTLRAGSRVRSPSDGAHTDRGVVVALPDVAPVALIRWLCGCRSYVPLRRLVVDHAPAPPRCEVADCPHPRWQGAYCAVHPDGPSRASVSFESEAGSASTNESAASAVVIIESPSEPKAPRAAGGARRGAPRTQSPAPVHAPPTARSAWSSDLVLARLREWVSTYGEAPSASDWSPALARQNGRTVAAERFEAADGHWPSVWVARGIFGTWVSALRAAGLEPHPAGRRRRAA